METTIAYIPMDRRQALAGGRSLPDRTTGAALFADISGFTPLTEALLKEYGPRRGAEELTRQLNLVYDALVSEVHNYSGSVLAFSGDAITCWFDGDDGLRTISCGLAMQQAIERFADIEMPSGRIVHMAMKVAVAVGPVRRFQLGDPQVQYIDALAGATLDQMAEAEHLAEKGELVIGPDVIAQIGEKVEVAEWRDDPATNEGYGVVRRVLDQHKVAATPWPPLAGEALPESEIRSWLLPPVYERLNAGKGEFLAELRPGVAVFLRFGGIDYDHDETAGAKLDNYIRWVQSVLARYEGYLLQLTIGDKGNYLCAAFGAPVAHEDDAVRAVSAALELRALPVEFDFVDEVQIGISQGEMRTGAYGGTMRRTYGVMGDEVNLAARLMQAAAPGQVLVSDTVRQAVADIFSWEQLPVLKVKGKAEPVTVFSLNGRQERRVLHLQEPNYLLPMVGREAELAMAADRLEQALAGRGQIVAIVAEAGMGKSRLVAEIIRLANERQLVGYGGECESYGTNISYLVWQQIWHGLFNLYPSWDVETQIQELEQQLAFIDPILAPRLPLLGAVLNLSIPDNELTRSFDAKLRKTSLESLLVDCLRAWARQAPLLLVLEDCHWLDPLSHELLEVIGRAIADLPVLLVMAYRPGQSDRLQTPRVERLAHFTEIQLAHFTRQEAEQLISLKLNQFFGPQTGLPLALVQRITARAEGNPFYIEELINYIHDRGFDPHDTKSLAWLELPTSLHSLILSRIDQLTENQKTVIKVASVIGRLFKAAWLWGMYPELGEPIRIKEDLEALSGLDLAPLDSPEPELAYLFKHIVTQEVAYASLPYATRAMLHEQLGLFIERFYSDMLDQYVDILAFHFERSQNEVKKRKYLRQAGEAAQADYANETAIDYYQRLLPLLPAEEQVTIMLKLGEVLQLVGRLDDAGDLYQKTLDLTEALGDRSARAWCQTATGELRRKQGLYDESLAWLDQARHTFEELGDQAGVGQVLHYEGTLAWHQGNYEAARRHYEESLLIRRQLDDRPRIASLLSNLGLVAHHQGDYEAARRLYEESLALRHSLGDQWAIAISLNNLGYLNIEQGNYDAARTQLEVAVNLYREVGERLELATALNNLGNVARDQGDYAEARTLYKDGLLINKELENKYGIAYLFEDLAGLVAIQGQAAEALRLFGAAEALREAIRAPLPSAEETKLQKMLAPARELLSQTVAAEVAAGREMSLEQAIDYALQLA